MGATKTSAAMAIMLSSFAIALLAGPPLKATQPRDVLLFLTPLANEAYFAYNALFGRGAAVESPMLRLFVLAVAACATVAYARAAGLLGATSASAAVGGAGERAML